MTAYGITLRVPRDQDRTGELRRLLDGIHNAEATYRADNLHENTQRAAALRGKSVAYREAADYLDALLRRRYPTRSP